MLRRKKQKPERQPSEPLPVPQLDAAEDYALELEEPEPDEEPQQQPAVLFDGPAKWDEVDGDDVQRIALNISRSAVPAAENSEVASRLAMQAAALEADNLDPLGLGRIDNRQLTLVRHATAYMNDYRQIVINLTLNACTIPGTFHQKWDVQAPDEQSAGKACSLQEIVNDWMETLSSRYVDVVLLVNDDRQIFMSIILCICLLSYLLFLVIQNTVAHTLVHCPVPGRQGRCKSLG